MQKMQGRFFSGRKVEASLWIGKQHFKRGKSLEARRALTYSDIEHY